MENTTPTQYDAQELMGRDGFSVRIELEGLTTASGNPLSEAVKAMVFEALYAFNDASKDLRSEAASLTRDMERVVRHLDEQYNVNELGEIQGKGQKFDLLCAKRQAAARTLVQGVHYLNRELEA